MFFSLSVGAAENVSANNKSEEEWKVPAMGLIVEWMGRIFIMANAEEQWVFKLPGWRGVLYFDGEDEGLWAPSVRQLVIRYLQNTLEGNRYILNKFRKELFKAKKEGSEIGVSYWTKQVRNYEERVALTGRLLDAVLNGQAEIRLVSWEELQKLLESRHEVEAI